MHQQIYQALISGRLGEAEQMARRLLAASPNDEGAILLLAMSLDAQSRTVDAIVLFEKLVQMCPQVAEYWINLGNARMTMGFHSGAREMLEKALELDPENASALRSLGELGMATGAFQIARDYLLRAQTLTPDDAALRSETAKACYECGDGDNAELLLQGWPQWAGGDPLILTDIAWIFARSGDSAQAEQALDRAQTLTPGHPRILARRAVLHERSNRLDEARATLAAIDERAAAAHGLTEEIAVVRASIAARGGDPEEACRLHEAVLADPAAQRRHLHLHFALARLHDKRGDVATAMSWLQRGHALQVAQLEAYNPNLFAPDADLLDTQRLRVTAEDVARWPTVTPPPAEQTPVFVVGFPRSGTTMLETMLDAHPGLAAMDERSFLQDVVKSMRGLGYSYPADLWRLDDAALQRLRDTYWHQVRTRARIAPGKRLVDKNPLNMLRLPLLARLFPTAKIILALRHPCDVVLSNYMQMFQAPAYAAMCATPESTARGYASAFEYWQGQAALVRMSVLELRYEDIVADIRTQSERIAAFLELPWDERMVNFHDRARERGFIATPSYHQVVEPVNSRGVGRWEGYRAYFDAALPLLQPWIERWNYEA